MFPQSAVPSQPQGAPLPQTPNQAQDGPIAPMGEAPAPLQIPPGVVTIDAVMRLLRDNAHRKFRIDIETDSTIMGDEAQEKQDRAEFTAMMIKYLETAGPMVTAHPEAVPLLGEVLLFNVRAYRAGRSLETAIEEFTQKMDEKLAQPQPPPQPSPDELMKLKGIEAKTQAEIEKAKIGVVQTQIDAQARIQEIQREAQLAQMEHGHAIAQGQQEAAIANQQAAQDRASQEMKAQIEQARYSRAIEAENRPSPSAGPR